MENCTPDSDRLINNCVAAYLSEHTSFSLTLNYNCEFFISLLLRRAQFVKHKSHTNQAEARKTGPHTLAYQVFFFLRILGCFYGCLPIVDKAN
jgi:hypothetical protein